LIKDDHEVSEKKSDSFQQILDWAKSPIATQHITMWTERQLTDWIPWKERDKLDCLGDQGLYFILEAKEKQAKKRDLLTDSVVCIGETHSQRLVDRLNQFDRAAFGNGQSHGPGWRLRQRRGNLSREKFYVAVLPLRLDEPWKSLGPPFLEGIFHWRYKVACGDLPEANQHPRSAHAFGLEPRPPRSK
jgi:hypothetical protein